MAKAKVARIDILRNAQTAFVKVSQEIENLHLLEKLAKDSGNDAVMKMFGDAQKRYDADYKYLADKRAYQLGKLIAEDAKMFNRILSEVLA